MDLDSNSNIDKGHKPSLKKEELEKIAKELKKKLSKASITAKQQQQQNISPTATRIHKSSANSSPLKELVSKKTLETPSKFNYLLSSSPLYSPNNKSPTHMRSSAAASLLSSSPILDSPIKKSKNPSPLKNQPTMILQSMEEESPVKAKSKSLTLKPSPPLNAQKDGETTPTMTKKLINPPPINSEALLKTPTQPNLKDGDYNDAEGADLLMYLATSPSPAKQYFPNTPKLANKPPKNSIQLNGEHIGSSVPNSSGPFSTHKHTSSNSSANSFIAPAPPLTPKRHIQSQGINSKTPQNRLTPSINLFNNVTNASGLPSSGLALTPAGFNMNDYVNFFSPSPGGANLGRNFLKTPDFNNLLANSQHGQKEVDGKMINFDKVGLFKNPESKD